MRKFDFDDVLEEIGPMGQYTVRVIILVGLTSLPNAYNAMANVFLAGLPDFTCSTGGNETQHPSESRYTDGNAPNTSLRLPKAPPTDTCYYTDGNVTEQCTDFTYDTDVFGSTIATKWDLVCGSEWKLALTQSTYMFGVLIGAIVFGHLSDKIGRKVTLCLSLVLMIVSACVTAFMPQYWMFAAMRFFVGANTCGMMTTGFVHTMEVLGKNYRTVVGIFSQGWFAVGYMLLAVAAYFIRDYRYLQLGVGLFSLIYLPLFCLLGESPRWLLAEGRYEEGVREVKRAARMNKRQVPASLLNSELTSFTQKEANQGEPRTENYTVAVLLKTPNMRRKTLNLWFQWLVVSMIYYGLSLGVSDLAGGPYLNLVLSGVMEFPGLFIAVLILDRVGRRLPFSAFNLIGGLSCIGMACVPQAYGAVVTSFSMLGKMAISANFALIYVYSVELFPTVVRTLGVGSGSMCARVGSLLSPFIALLGKYWKPLPYLIFGAFAIISGLLALLLPETLHQPLPESIQDGESFGKNAHKHIFKVHHASPDKTRVDVKMEHS